MSRPVRATLKLKVPGTRGYVYRHHPRVGQTVQYAEAARWLDLQWDAAERHGETVVQAYITPE